MDNQAVCWTEADSQVFAFVVQALLAGSEMWLGHHHSFPVNWGRWCGWGGIAGAQPLSSSSPSWTPCCPNIFSQAGLKAVAYLNSKGKKKVREGGKGSKEHMLRKALLFNLISVCLAK